MSRIERRLLIAMAALAVLPLAAACSKGSDAAAVRSPAIVTAVKGSAFKRVELSPEAARRLDIQTGVVGQDAAGTVIPYAAVLYAPDGETWTYTTTGPLQFLRRRITVASIDGDRAMLTDGPPVGTAVVTVGAAELLGAETGVGAD
jgi:hypothetical protein